MKGSRRTSIISSEEKQELDIITSICQNIE